MRRFSTEEGKKNPKIFFIRKNVERRKKKIIA
jgi:hypothetical protein